MTNDPTLKYLTKYRGIDIYTSIDTGFFCCTKVGGMFPRLHDLKKHIDTSLTTPTLPIFAHPKNNPKEAFSVVRILPDNSLDCVRENDLSRFILPTEGVPFCVVHFTDNIPIFRNIDKLENALEEIAKKIQEERKKLKLIPLSEYLNL